MADFGETGKICEKNSVSFYVLKLLKRPVSAIAPGETLTYTITASNAGPSVANSVVIYDELDSNVTFVSASDGGFINTDSGDSILV